MGDKNKLKNENKDFQKLDKK